MSLSARPKTTAACLALAGLLTLGAAFSARAQTALPPPTPFQAPLGQPPATSSTANGRLGAAPIAPRAGDLAPASPVDATAARGAAARNAVPLPASVEQRSAGALERRERAGDNPSPAISPAGAGNAPAGTPIR